MTYFQFIHAVETKVKKEVEEEKTVKHSYQCEE